MRLPQVTIVSNNHVYCIVIAKQKVKSFYTTYMVKMLGAMSCDAEFIIDASQKND